MNLRFGYRGDTRDHKGVPGQHHITELDGLRGLAVLLVCISHYAEQMSGSTWERAVFRLAQSGWLGVDLFFALSGYLITGILLETRESPGYLRNFFARRILRIFPLYYFALALYFCFFRSMREPGASEPALLWFVGYGSNVFTAIAGWPARFVGHFWSLAVEEQFYLLWPFFVLALPAHRLFGFCISLWICALVLRWALAYWAVDPVVLYVITPFRIDPLAAGAALAICMRTSSGKAAIATWCRRLLPVSGVIMALLTVHGRGFFYWHWSPIFQAIGYAALATACASTIGLCLTAASNHPLNRCLRNPVLVSFGKYSYSVYVFHLWLDTLARHQSLHPSQHPSLLRDSLLSLAAYTALQLTLAMGIAWITWNLLEKHALALKRHFEFTKRPCAAAAVVAT